ncbi:MAG: DUF6046 domain-containing protein [Prevotellaceae bacterium]|jgi:hypothetical protein|nr:DUF6046 domain-containing protein [Prevotellaceae bacterium]
MKAYWNSVWESLKFSVGSTGDNVADSISFRFLKKQDGNLTYINNRGYKNVIVHVARQAAMQLVERQVNSLFPKYQRYLETKMRDGVLKQQKENLQKIIEAGERVDKGLGFITVNKKEIFAKNRYGERVPEALMMYYESGEVESKSYMSVVFIDLVASVTVQSSKNLILTQVQGRDYTRKELVSGGDLTFSVNGKIVGNGRGIYPENDVNKFIMLAQYGGVIKVNHYLFRQFNIKQIIIKEFSLGSSDCKNVQPYSFTCVAVEPDEAVRVVIDTIGVLNMEIKESTLNSWYKFILEDKLSSIAADTVASGVTQLAATGLDALIPNI